jgi:hypothetical protein
MSKPRLTAPVRRGALLFKEIGGEIHFAFDHAPTFKGDQKKDLTLFCQYLVNTATYISSLPDGEPDNAGDDTPQEQ